MTALAKEKINVAIQNKSKTLNLGKCGLTTIPAEVLEMDWLEELILNNIIWDSTKNTWVEELNGAPNRFTTLPNDIAKLSKLKILRLSGDRNHGSHEINNLEILQGLKKLQLLDVCYNNISDAHFIQNLTNLNSLYISYNNISDTSFIQNLTNLNSLDIGNNNISDASFIQNLTNLKFLYISSNNISDVSFIQNLTNLNSLYISSNNISDVSFIQNLTNLSFLYISFNNISDVSFIQNLINLNSLDISNNNISNVSFIQNLINLNSLDISNNKHIQDFSFIQNLTNLNSLDISNNNISNVSFIQNLTNLNSLNISNNNISDASFIQNLTNLYSLNISNNNISDASLIQNLTNLNSLNISNNNFDDFELFLPLVKKGIPVRPEKRYNQIGVFIEENPWSIPPMEILQNGNEAIIDYFNNLQEQGKSYLYEAKMILVGKGGVGKTSLNTKLQDRNNPLPEEKATTKGIDIDQLIFQNEENKTFTINIWDFGGQEIYHATHQFFLTERSLYVLVDDTKDDDKTVNDASFKYWLQTVELFGDNSPLLIFQNEKGGRSKDLDLGSMKARFDFIQDRYADNLLAPRRGLDDFERAIKYHVQKLPHIGQVLPKQWVEIRKELQHLSSDHYYITAAKYYEICQAHNISETSAMLNLSKYLHDLGSFLHFQKDDLLRKTIILQNEWATDAVYKVLDDESVKKNKGVLSKKDAASIWKDSQYADMHPELLALMVRFELCYPLNKRKKTYLIPQLLPESRPKDFSWNTDQNLQLKYNYEFLPKGLLNRIMVRMNTYLRDIETSWRRGVILEYQDTKAFIEEKYAINEIVIRIRGKNTHAFMSIVVAEFDKLNDEYEGMMVEKLIPCNCETCLNIRIPHFYNFDKVVERLFEGKDTIECIQKPYIDVPVRELLRSFEINVLEEKLNPLLALTKGKLKAKEINIYYDSFNTGTTITNEKGNVIAWQDGNGNISINDDESRQPTSEFKDTLRPEINQSSSLLQKWWFQRLAVSFLAGIFSMLIAWWFDFSHSFSAFLIVFPALTAVLFYFGNPERRFFRAANIAFSSAMGILALQLGVKFDWTQKVKNGNFKLALEWLTEYDWLIGIILILLSGYLFWLDWKKDQNGSKE